jgi:hypothetical protein
MGSWKAPGCQFWVSNYVQRHSRWVDGPVQIEFLPEGTWCSQQAGLEFYLILTIVYQGFTDPDYASLYISDVDCELQGKDQMDPNKITQSSFATVIVKMTPIPRPDDDAGTKQKGAKKEEDVQDASDDDEGKSVESKATEPSKKSDAKKEDVKGKPGGSDKGSKKSSVRTSQKGSRATSSPCTHHFLAPSVPLTLLLPLCSDFSL